MPVDYCEQRGCNRSSFLYMKGLGSGVGRKDWSSEVCVWGYSNCSISYHSMGVLWPTAIHPTQVNELTSSLLWVLVCAGVSVRWQLDFLLTVFFASYRKPSFVDLGCGNGFLVYILVSEGYPGKGIDLQKRKIWDTYPPNVELIHEEFHPETASFSGVDWIIGRTKSQLHFPLYSRICLTFVLWNEGNHSDELTPWIPYIASRSDYNTK